MPSGTRMRAALEADAELACINQILILQDACKLFDEGRDHQFLNMAVSLRTLCHSGSSGCLLNAIRERGRVFPSSVQRNFRALDSAACDHFVINHGAEGVQVSPRLELNVATMKPKKFKHWWAEVIVTDERKRQLSRGNIVLAIANNEGGLILQSMLMKFTMIWRGIMDWAYSPWQTAPGDHMDSLPFRRF